MVHLFWPSNHSPLFQLRQGPGSLEKIGPVPLAIVRGSPEEMGRQLGLLLAKPLADMAARQDQLLAGFGLAAGRDVLLKTGNLMAGHFPPNHLAELKAISQAAGVRYDFLLFGNVIYDYSKIGGCSALLVEPSKSATGEVLFGRNMDFPTFGFLDRCGLVVVYFPTDKHAFASVTFPGFVGCISGMNDAGLCVAQLEVNQAADGSSQFTPTGIPLALCFRRVLEECATIDDAEKLLGNIKRTSMCNMAICDQRNVAVLEITTRTVVRREAQKGYCACTNHFRARPLCVNSQCARYTKLEHAFSTPKVDLTTLTHKLNEVNQGKLTIQSMIFEPSNQNLHLVMGQGPVSGKQMQSIELGPIFMKKME